MRAATLFSGIGAPETARPDWEWLWHAEIEKFSSEVMAARHPRSVNLGDVNAEDFCERAERIGRPGVLVFGSPCQSYSIAGRRLGMDDPRGNLALVALGIVDRLKPRWFVFENVPGLLSSWSGGPDVSVDAFDGRDGGIEGVENSDFAAFLGAVDELGYSGAWAILDSQWRGVAQRRERLFFVGHLGDDWRPPAAVLFEPAGLRGDYPPGRKAGKGLAPTLSARARGGGGLGTDFDLDGGLVAAEVAGAVSAKWRKGTGGPAGDECYNLVAFDTTQITHPANRSVPTDLSPQLTAADHAPTIAFSAKDYGHDAQTEVSPTLRAGAFDQSHANGGVMPAVVQTVALRGREGGATAELGGVTATALRATQGGGDKSYILDRVVRRLTPLECERLQDFPDGYTKIKYRGRWASDGPRYTALGNSMTVSVIRLIMDRIDAVDALLAAARESEMVTARREGAA